VSLTSYPIKRRGYKKVGLCLYSPSGSSWPLVGQIL